MSIGMTRPEIEQIVNIEIQARREKFTLDFSEAMTRSVGVMAVGMAILWFFIRTHIQLLLFAFLLAQLAVSMGLYPGLRQRGRAVAGAYLALFSLMLTATCGFVLVPETSLAALLAHVVTVVIASLILDRRKSFNLIVIVVLLVVADAMLMRVTLPESFVPLDETAGTIANLLTIVIAFFTTGIMIRMIAIEQEDFFRQSRQAEEALKEAYVEIRVLNERLQDDNLRMAAELDVTRKLQQMLLPTDEELRQVQGMDIAGFMLPAEEVGGDYYDVLQLGDQVKIGIGDVTGHGLESGVVMLMLQTAVRTLISAGITDVAQFISILNRVLHANMARMKVDKSMSLVLLDYQAGRMRLDVSGQHEQLIVVRQGGKVELLDTVDLGFPLGLEAEIDQFVSELSVELQPGDGVVLYSDGFTEAENAAGDFYGLERLCEVVGQHWAGTAEEIKAAVVSDARAFIGEHTVYDDLALLIVKQR